MNKVEKPRKIRSRRSRKEKRRSRRSTKRSTKRRSTKRSKSPKKLHSLSKQEIKDKFKTDVTDAQLHDVNKMIKVVNDKQIVEKAVDEANVDKSFYNSIYESIYKMLIYISIMGALSYFEGKIDTHITKNDKDYHKYSSKIFKNTRGAKGGATGMLTDLIMKIVNRFR